MISRTIRYSSKAIFATRKNFATVNPPVLFDYDTIRNNLKPSVLAVEAIETAFGKLAKGEVDVPIPMHIGIHESDVRIR
jgi:hypothetical protein